MERCNGIPMEIFRLFLDLLFLKLSLNISMCVGTSELTSHIMEYRIVGIVAIPVFFFVPG